MKLLWKTDIDVSNASVIPSSLSICKTRFSYNAISHSHIDTGVVPWWRFIPPHAKKISSRFSHSTSQVNPRTKEGKAGCADGESKASACSPLPVMHLFVLQGAEAERAEGGSLDFLICCAYTELLVRSGDISIAWKE